MRGCGEGRKMCWLARSKETVMEWGAAACEKKKPTGKRGRLEYFFLKEKAAATVLEK